MIIKNKFTGESKGLGYVRYYKPSQAALAIENCDKSKTDSLCDFIICIRNSSSKMYREMLSFAAVSSGVSG